MENCLQRRTTVISPSLYACPNCDCAAAPMKWTLSFQPFILDFAVSFFGQWGVSKRDTGRDLKSICTLRFAFSSSWEL